VSIEGKSIENKIGEHANKSPRILIILVHSLNRKSQLKRLDQIVSAIKGSPEKFTYSERNLHILSIAGIILLSLFIVFNTIAGIGQVNWIIFVCNTALLGVFYLSRFKRKNRVSTFFFHLTIYTLLATAFIANDGLDGPLPYMLFVSLALLFVINPSRQAIDHFFLHALLMIGLFLLNYFYPEVIIHNYENRSQRHLDLAFTAMSCLLFLYFAFRSIQRNMSDDKQLVEQTNQTLEQQRLALDEALADKEKLISILAHDLRAPLASIKGYFQLITSTELAPEQKRELDTQMMNMTAGSLNMLEELTQWASAKTTKMQLERVNLSDLQQSLLGLLSPLAEVKGIRIISKLDQQEEAVLADMRMLRVVLRNLSTNAVKFTEQNGEIELFASKTEDNSLNLHIKDNGVGMKQSTLEQLFKHHVTSSKGTNDEMGNGLGLFICGEFVTLMGGEIKVRSTPNKGSEFIVKLPAYVATS
jgi:signal transduction histidine kinase